MNLEQRIHALESAWRVPGTTISRVLIEDNPAWCIALGELADRKKMFYAKSITECVEKAEAWMNESA